MKEEKVIEINVSLNIEAVHSAAMNASDLKNVAFEVPCVNPRELTIDSKVYGFKIVPVDDQVKQLGDDDARCIAVQSTVVDSLDKNQREGYITVNGRIDIPMTHGKMVQLEEVFLAKQEDAHAIAEVLTEVELQKAMDIVEKKQKVVDFLKEQLENKRW